MPSDHDGPTPDQESATQFFTTRKLRASEPVAFEGLVKQKDNTETKGSTKWERS
jgi:hypothetical protein